MRDNIQKIEVDYEKMIIKCGNLFELDEYIEKIDWRFISLKCGLNKGISSNVVPYRINDKTKYRKSTGTKEQNKQLTELLGLTPTYYSKLLRGAMFNLWIKPHEEDIRKLCMSHYRNNHRFIPSLVKKYYNNIDLINQYKNDNQYNLLPIAFYFNKNPYELKKEFGKSIWKSLHKNSFTRNLLISKSFFHNTIYEDSALEHIVKLSPSLLCKRYVQYDKSSSFLQNFLKRERALTTKKYNVEHISIMAQDTYSMSLKLNKNFNVDWSLDKLQEKHEEYTKEIQKNRYPDTFIKSLKDITPKEFINSEYIAILLTTPYKINLQGKQQHHCVGSYIQRVQEGDYLVYDIQKNGVTVSTLGLSKTHFTERISIIKDKEWKINQHYGSCNSQVDEQSAIFANELLKEVNKKERLI